MRFSFVFGLVTESLSQSVFSRSASVRLWSEKAEGNKIHLFPDFLLQLLILLFYNHPYVIHTFHNSTRWNYWFFSCNSTLPTLSIHSSVCLSIHPSNHPLVGHHKTESINFFINFLLPSTFFICWFSSLFNFLHKSAFLGIWLSSSINIHL